MKVVKSFGVLFVRSKPITEVLDRRDNWVKARNPGSLITISPRRFRSLEEAEQHGKRFKRIEKHAAFHVIVVRAEANAKVNRKTGKTNPLIGRKRTNRR